MSSHLGRKGESREKKVFWGQIAHVYTYNFRVINDKYPVINTEAVTNTLLKLISKNSNYSYKNRY